MQSLISTTISSNYLNIEMPTVKTSLPNMKAINNIFGSSSASALHKTKMVMSILTNNGKSAT